MIEIFRNEEKKVCISINDDIQQVTIKICAWFSSDLEKLIYQASIKENRHFNFQTQEKYLHCSSQAKATILAVEEWKEYLNHFELYLKQIGWHFEGS
mgnify:FL=1